MLYTRNGDAGKSSLIDKNGIYKSNIIFDVLGTIDELSAFLGAAKLLCSDDLLKSIEKIQKDLICIGTYFAGGDGFDFSGCTSEFEYKIDSLKDLCSCGLVIYGANERSVRFDVARAVCRKTERYIVKYSLENECAKSAIAYFNRLSDYLYAVAHCFEKE